MGLNLKRGDIVICTVKGHYGKPRPAVVVQSDLFNPTHTSITVCPITTHIVEAPLFRLLISPNSKNGLKCPSQIMVDKMTTLPQEKVRQQIGVLSLEQIKKLDESIKMWLNLE